MLITDVKESVENTEVALEGDVSSYVSMLADEELETFADKVTEPVAPDKKDNATEEVKEPILDPTAKGKEEEPEAKADSFKSTNKKEFVFNRKQYEDKGITDEKVLKILEDRDKQIHHEQKTIGSLGRDKGQLLQTIAQLESQKISKDDINELSLTDHEKATESVIHNKNIDTKIQEANLQLHKSQVQDIVVGRFPDFESQIDIMGELLIEDGIDKGIVSAFKNDPYATDVPVLINLFKRAEQKQSVTGIESKYKTRISELEAENKALKENAKLVTNGLRNTGKIKTLDNLPSQVTEEDEKLSDVDFSLMTDEELGIK